MVLLSDSSRRISKWSGPGSAMLVSQVPPVQNRVRIRFGAANDYSWHRADRHWRRVGLRRAHLVASGTAERTRKPGGHSSSLWFHHGAIRKIHAALEKVGNIQRPGTHNPANL